MWKIQITKQNICKALFADTYNNVNIYLTQIVNAYNSGLIDKKPEYKDLITIYAALKSDDASVLKTLKKYEGQNFEGLLYDAYKDAMYSTFNAIKAECYSFDEEHYDEKLSSKAGVKVYNIKKLPKKMLINVSRADRDAVLKNSEVEKYLDMYVYERTSRNIKQDYKSLSFVDNHNIKAYRDINNFVTFVYPPDIPNDLLITIARKDAEVDFKDKQVYTQTAPYLSKPQTLLDSTNECNEVAVLRKGPHGGHEVKPMAIFCCKRITEYEKQAAKYLNIPIIYSETEFVQKKYTNKTKYDYSCVKNSEQIKSDFDELTI
ncbi:MAG: hypothetical protein E7376_01780 [Clostridiales bacterium]|nr:hypothetical protein [Clostridiales bacterium]